MGYKRHFRSIFIKLLISTLAVTAAYIFYRMKKKDFLDKGLQKLVVKKTQGIYKISFDSIRVDEVGGDLYIKNLYIKGDTLRQMQLISNRDTNAAKVILDVYIPLLRVVDFRTARALLSKQLQCDRILLENPKVRVYFFPGQGKQKTEKDQQQELYKQILGNLKLIQADSVIINNTEVLAQDFFTKEIKFQAFNTTVNVKDLRVDSTYKEDTTRTLFCKEIKVSSQRVKLGEKDNTAEITSLTFDTRSKIILLSRFNYDAFKNRGFFKTSLHNIAVEGFEWKGPAERSELIIKSINLKKGEIETLAGKGGEQNKSPQANEKILTGWIKRFSLNKLEINSFSLVSRSHHEKKQPLIINNNSLLLKSVKVDTLAKLNQSLVNHIGEAEFNNNELTIISKDKFYTYKISGFNLNTKKRRLKVNGLAIIPAYSESEFARRSKIQKDRFDATINSIECNGVDISKLLQGKFYSNSVTTTNSRIKVYRDLSYASSGIIKTGSYPHQMLFKLQTPLKINKFTAVNTYIEYKEKSPLSDSSGRVYFSNADVTITNISNLPPAEGDEAKVEFSSNFLGALPFRGFITFHLAGWQKGTFKTVATIPKSFDAIILNQLTKPLALIEIKSGIMDYIKAEITGDNYNANGKLLMTYHDFKIAMLKKKGEEINRRNLLTLLANTMIKNKNEEGNDMRTATILKKRDITKSFFNFVWASIFTGGQQILGVRPNK